MKTILVPVEPHDSIESSVETAWLLGKTFDSYIEGVLLSPALNAFMATDGITSMVIQDTALGADREAARESREIYERAMAAHGLPRDANERQGPSFGWLEGESLGDGFVGSYGRVFDVIVIGRPRGANTSPRMSTLEAALFESGRPVLIAPAVPPRQLGEVATIAWNGSTETARAIAFALPILKRARRTNVLTVEGAGVPGPTGDQVVGYLRRNGIPCEAHSVKPEGRSTGAAILEEAANFGSDLIVKGAFTQSRLRQMIFGGATRHIIAEATLPVFMAH